MKINPVNNVNHKGIPIADIKVKGIDSCYKLYKVNYADKEFLEKMYLSIDLKKLMPKMSQRDYVLWDEIIKNAISLSKSKDTKTIFETSDNKPCGIMNYKEICNRYHVSYVATFPTEEKKRIPCAGQILFNELFKRFTQSDKDRIELSAIREAPFDPISVYLKLGFRMSGGDDYCEYMGINKNNAAGILLKQNDFITYNPIKNAQKIDLQDEIKLDTIV